jgi:adenosylmethionine-8-amino-7-oxononanoate aminotransferase
VAEVRGLGLLQAVELVRDRETLEPFPAEARLGWRVVVQGLLRGVFFYPGGTDPARDVVCLGPPFVIENAEIELLARVLGEAIDAAVASVAPDR